MPPDHSRNSAGLSLVELLMVMLLSAGITAAVSHSLITMIRSDSQLELQQRAIDQWSRISFLIDSEVGEGEAILRDQPFAECGGGRSLFTIQVPVPLPTPPGQPLTVNERRIHYFTREGSLLRCGPPFHANGSLHGTEPAQEALVGRRVRLELVPPQSDPRDREQGRSVHYHLNILTADGKELFHPDRSSIARTRVAPLREE